MIDLRISLALQNSQIFYLNIYYGKINLGTRNVKIGKIPAKLALKMRIIYLYVM